MSEALDFAVTCSCGSPAMSFLELHAVDFCLMGEPTVGGFRCQPCLDREMARIEEIVSTGTEWCSNCGLTMVTIADMVVRLSPV